MGIINKVEMLRQLRIEEAQTEAHLKGLRRTISGLEALVSAVGGASEASQGASAGTADGRAADPLHHRTGVQASEDTKEKMRTARIAYWKNKREKKAAELAARGEAEGGGGAIGEGQGVEGSGDQEKGGEG
jgi:hypothetical protein